MDLGKKRKENGLCVQCGEELDREGILCKRCNEIGNERKKIYHYDLREANLCLRCSQPIEREKGSYCNKCLEVKRKIDIEKKELRKKNGLCVQCGEKTEDGYVYCDKCRRRKRELYKAKKNGIKLEKIKPGKKV